MYGIEFTAEAIKDGFVQEGVLRQRIRKWGVFEDVKLWAILKKDWCSETE